MAWPVFAASATLPLVTDHEYHRARKRLALAMKRRRIELGLTQEDVADRLGIVPRQYQKLESGGVNITLRTLARIANALEMPARDLL